MEYKQLYIFVEGPDDERFINSVIKPILDKKYSLVKVIKYATLSKVVIENFIKTYDKQSSSDYLFLCDMDARGNKLLCITKRKAKELNTYSFLNINKIVIVREEIESWYFAGINQQKSEEFKVKWLTDTHLLTKEAFMKIIPKGFNSSNDFMVEILKNYSLEEAILRNQSLKYFSEKHF